MRRITIWITATLAVVALLIAYQIGADNQVAAHQRLPPAGSSSHGHHGHG